LDPSALSGSLATHPFSYLAIEAFDHEA